MMFLNGQALIQMARKRLCSGAHIETVDLMTIIRTEVRKVDSALALRMVPECVYRNGYCPELRCCGYNEINKM